MTRYTRIFITLLLLTICSITGKSQGFETDDKYRFSAGIDLAKPLIALSLNQIGFTAFVHYGFLPNFGLSFCTGFESGKDITLAHNVNTTYSSVFAELWFDVKLTKMFWISGGYFMAQSFNTYTASLAAVNFYPVERNFKTTQAIEGLVGRLSINDFLTDKISAQFYADLGLLALQQVDGPFTTKANPGFIEDLGNTVSFGFGWMFGYRFGHRKTIATTKS